MVVVIWMSRSPESVHEFTLVEIMSATSNFANAHFNSDHYKKRNLDKTFCRPGIYKGFFENRKVVVKCFNKFSGDHEWLVRSYLWCPCLIPPDISIASHNSFSVTNLNSWSMRQSWSASQWCMILI